MGFKQITIRVDEDDLAVADRLVPLLKQLEYMDQAGNVTQAAVLRIAIHQGLATLGAKLSQQEEGSQGVSHQTEKADVE